MYIYGRIAVTTFILAPCRHKNMYQWNFPKPKIKYVKTFMYNLTCLSKSNTYYLPINVKKIIWKNIKHP